MLVQFLLEFRLVPGVETVLGHLWWDCSADTLRLAFTKTYLDSISSIYSMPDLWQAVL